jgi:hypothetical protein
VPKKIATALKRLAEARSALERAVRSELPTGSRVSWRHGNYRQYGTVVDHGHSGRIMVENEMSGARRWLLPTDLAG